MIYLSFAIYAEAAPFIKKLQLKAENRQTGFQVFSSDNFKLVITGTGNLNSAINLTAFLSGEKVTEDDFFINIGSASSSFYSCKNQLFICNKLKELSTGRSFYPDILYHHDFTEAICLTSPVTVADASHSDEFIFPEEALTPVIFDMEASSCYQAAIRYFNTHKMFFLKYTSDTGADKVSGQLINITPEPEVVENILQFISALPTEKNKHRDVILREKAEQSAALLAPFLSCSVTMKHELSALLLYCECCGVSSEKLVKDFIAQYNDIFPVCKKQGKIYFERLKSQITDLQITGDNDVKNKLSSQTSAFAHIYVERQSLAYPLTRNILERFDKSTIIYIEHYKDIFNRKGQNFLAEKYSPALILGVNTGERIYPGARTCQSFGHEYFYYTSQIKNCIYDCEYCYLQGMYPSGNINIFVNTEDYLRDVDEMLKEHPVSLSISYDTDMTALNGITKLLEKWCEFASERKNLTIEIRTKCGSPGFFEKTAPPSNAVFAYTISPDIVAKNFEHNASRYKARKKALYKSLESGCTTRLSLDPILPVPDFERVYTEMIDDIFSNPVTQNISDVSIGSFRISREYIRQMQSVRLNGMTTYPYAVRDGICTFDEVTHRQMMKTIKTTLLKHIKEDRIYEFT